MSSGQWLWGMKPGPHAAPHCPPCSPPRWHTQQPPCSAELVFHSADTCGQGGQPWAQTRAPLLGAHTSAAGPAAVVPPSAMVAPDWEAQSRLDGFSITHVGSALGCLIPGMWLSSGCGGQRGAGDLMGSVWTFPNAAQGSTQILAPVQALCCRERDSWGALGCPK